MTHARQIAAALATMLALGSTTGCSGVSDNESTDTAEQARSVPSLSAYCDVQVLRRMIADGDVKQSALPDTADLTEVDGTPLIVDFTKQPTESTTVTVGQLLDTPGLAKVEINDAERQTCIDTTTDADIKKSQGGPGYLSAQGD